MVRKQRATGSSGQGTPITTLSLFLLLLVFFAVLGANSEWRQHRTDPVLRSIEEQFGGNRQDSAQLGDAWQTARAALQAIGDLLRREFPIAKVREAKTGAAWFVDVPAAGLFEIGRTQIRPDQVGLMFRIARTLSEPPAGIRYRAAALVALSGPVDDGPGSVERAAALGSALVDGGAPAESVAIGLEAGEAGMIRFYFAIEPDDRG